jgi:hypothetical protein
MTQGKSLRLLPFPHRHGCFCVRCMAIDRVNELQKNLWKAEDALAKLNKAQRPTAADMAKMIDV